MNSISIIIATYNAGQFLQKCLDSIIQQKNINIELIIIDGASTDDTLSVIDNNRKHITYAYSESDEGIYDAWNKGLKKATGDWILFLGADDELLPNAIDKYLSLLKTVPDMEKIDIVSSRCRIVNDSGKTLDIRGRSFEWPLFLKEMMIAHPGTLHSRNLFNKLGFFNINYKIVGDFEFLLRAGKDLNALFLDEITVNMREGGASDSVKAILEHCKAAMKTGKYPLHKAYLNTVKVMVKFGMKKMIGKAGLTGSYSIKKTKYLDPRKHR